MKGLSPSGIWVKSGQTFQLKRWARRMSSVSLMPYTTMGAARIQHTVSTRNGMLVTWSRCEWLTKMWSIRARLSRGRSPTPVPASTRMSSSTSSAVVRRLPPMPPLHPRTLIRILLTSPARRRLAAGPRGPAGTGHYWRNPPRRGVRRGTPAAPIPRPAGPAGSRLEEELHLDPGDLDHVVVGQGVRRGAQGGAIERGVARALD